VAVWLRRATQGAAKIAAELQVLKQQLRELQEEGRQLPLPLGRRKRGLSDKWLTILNYLVLRAPNPITVEELFAFATDNELGISRTAMRAQLHHYEKRGLVERVSDGVYLATSAARAFCDY
jgi:DNA-binding HxlR family transcriptional regulator